MEYRTHDRTVQAIQWNRSPGPCPKSDNYAEVIAFIGTTQSGRVTSDYDASVGDETLYYSTDATPLGMDRVHPGEWIVLNVLGHPMTLENHIFGSLFGLDLLAVGRK